MKRVDLLLVLILVVLLGVLLFGLVSRPQQQPSQAAVAAQPMTLPTELANAERQINQINAQLPIMTPVPDSFSNTFENWERLQGSGVSLALPAQFDGGLITQETVDASVDAAELPPVVAQMIRQISDNFAFFAYDTETLESGFVINVNILQETIPEGTEVPTLSQLMDMTIEQELPGVLEVVRNQIVPLGNRDAIRFELENYLMSDTPLRQLAYSFIEGNSSWTITYSAPREAFAAMLPVFETSARTIAFGS